MKKQLTIARRADLTDYFALKQDPKVPRVLDLPYEYVIFEFWDDAYPKLYDREKKYHQDPELLKKAAEIREETNALIKPLYSRATAANFVSGLGFTLNNNEYTMAILRKERFIDTMYGKLEPIRQDCKCESIFKEIDEKRKIAFEKMVDEWQKWAVGLSLLRSCEPPVYEDKKAALMIHFPEKFEDALAALIIMLNHTRLKSGVVKVVY